MSDQIRSGCQDIWNAFMVAGACFTSRDIPLCPTTASELLKNTCFDELKSQGINIMVFSSQTSIAFERRKDHE